MPDGSARARVRLILHVLLLLLLACPAHAWAQAASAREPVLAGRVTRVIDGDTLDVLLASGRIRVRLHGVDAPEQGQPGGRESRLWLQQQAHDQDVQLEPVSQDRYDRLVAIVHLRGAALNAQLLRAGQAWAYRHYLRRADRSYCQLEAAARGARLGLWGAAEAHAPWEYRRTAGKGPYTDYRRQSAGECWRRRADS